ncbi:MAG: GNAT family N-acyltransferase [bacterium]
MKTKNFTIPVAKSLLESELTEATLARMWRGFEIHFVKKQTAPYVLQEVNRISTLMFHLDAMDGDVFDSTYTYIVVYDRPNGEILSFYRYILCKNAIFGSEVRLSTADYFKFSPTFVDTILPTTIEFGRSVVNKTAKNAFLGLEAVWIGIGVVIYEYYLHPKDTKIEYFFGKFSLQWDVYSDAAKDMILYLFMKHFAKYAAQDLVISRYSNITLDFAEAHRLFSASSYEDDRKILQKYLKNIGLPMPKLADSYAKLGGLISLAMVSNAHLHAWETAVLQIIKDINSFYIKRFVDSYVPSNAKLFL